MNPTSQDIKDMLTADTDLSLTFATNLFIGREPVNPDNCVTIFDTPGFPPEMTLDGNSGYEYPSIQIRVRNKTYQAGWAKAQAIKDSLHGRNHETKNATLYTVISCSSGPAFLGWDSEERAKFIINFNVQRR